MSLRPYQIKGKAEVYQAFASGIQALIFCMPTGAGKTVSFADMAQDFIKQGMPVMVLCNRRELISQAERKLKKSGLHPTLIIPSYRDKVSNLYLASVDTLKNRKYPEIKVLIIDEAHIRDFDPIALYYKAQGVKIIGATATPTRDGKAFIEEYPDYSGQLSDIYQTIITPTTITELLQDEFLVPGIHYGAEMDMSDVEVKRGSKVVDYSEKSLFEKFNKPVMYGGVVDKYLKLTPDTKALVFNINVEHSIKQTEEFRLRGIASAHVDGKTPTAERHKIFNDFKHGHIKVLNNCSVATTGYDEPSIETVIVNRSTMSVSLWLQMCGRGSRPCTEINKTFFHIIDMGSNIPTHLWWHLEREYFLDKKYMSNKEGVGPIRECEQCEALIPLSYTSCPYCNKLQQKREEMIQQLAEAEFVVLDSSSIPVALKKPLQKMTIPELELYRELKEYRVGWIVRQLITRGEDALKEYAALETATKKPYSVAWAYKQLEMSQGERVASKAAVLEFIHNNPHVGPGYLKEYSIKKLKATHTPQELAAAIPKILDLYERFIKGEVTIEI